MRKLGRQSLRPHPSQGKAEKQDLSPGLSEARGQGLTYCAIGPWKAALGILPGIRGRALDQLRSMAPFLEKKKKIAEKSNRKNGHHALVRRPVWVAPALGRCPQTHTHTYHTSPWPPVAISHCKLYYFLHGTPFCNFILPCEVFDEYLTASPHTVAFLQAALCLFFSPSVEFQASSESSM